MATQRKKKAAMRDPREPMRAAVCLLNTAYGTEYNKAFAFLSILHPEISLEKRLRMAREISGETR